jgi:pyruvate formate lyase activating enzyme
MKNQKKSNPQKDDHGLVFNIQKFSLHDGSGIRTLIFLKGCPLKCKWCANPEGQSHLPELAFAAEKCIGIAECGLCVPACQVEAVSETDDGMIAIDRKRCTNCGDCVDACPARALELFGDFMSADDLIRIVEEDSAFYARSGGGLTVSGGEPLMQAEFVILLLQAAQGRGIDTAIETTGFCDWDVLESACRSANQVFYDIKSLDPEKHKSEAGVDNRVIVENLQKLCRHFPDLSITVRTPVVPGFNDSPEDIRAIAELIERLPGAIEFELLPYHRFGESKYQQLGKGYPLTGLEPPPHEQIIGLKRFSEVQESS